jgi:hypothetical protein
MYGKKSCLRIPIKDIDGMVDGWWIDKDGNRLSKQYSEWEGITVWEPGLTIESIESRRRALAKYIHPIRLQHVEMFNSFEDLPGQKAHFCTYSTKEEEIPIMGIGIPGEEISAGVEVITRKEKLWGVHTWSNHGLSFDWIGRKPTKPINLEFGNKYHQVDRKFYRYLGYIGMFNTVLKRLIQNQLYDIFRDVSNDIMYARSGRLFKLIINGRDLIVKYENGWKIIQMTDDTMGIIDLNTGLVNDKKPVDFLKTKAGIY